MRSDASGNCTLIRLTSNSRRSSAAFLPSAESACFFTCTVTSFGQAYASHRPAHAVLIWRAGRCVHGDQVVHLLQQLSQESLILALEMDQLCARTRFAESGGRGTPVALQRLPAHIVAQ